MKWLLAIAVITLAGCATNQPLNLANYRLVEDQNFYHPEGKDHVIVRWIRLPAEPLQQACRQLAPVRSRNAVYLGCATKNLSNICTIYTATDTTHQIFGHELRHCFQGNFHK
jgi:hypothetical protein